MLLEEQQNGFVEKEIRKKNGTSDVLVYGLQGCFRVKNQKYILEDAAARAPGIQSYLACKAECISWQWVAKSNETIKTIGVVSDILVYDEQAPEVIVMINGVCAKAQKPHKNVERVAADAKRFDTTVVLVESADKIYHYATEGVDKTEKTL